MSPRATVLITTAAGSSEPGAPSRGLVQDILRGLAAIALGFSSGLLIALVTGTLNPFYVLWTVLVGPTLFLVVLIGRASQDRQLSWVRLLGALGGWIFFVALFEFYPWGHQWLFSFRSFALVPGSLLAAGFVALGEVLGDLMVKWTRMAQSRERTR